MKLLNIYQLIHASIIQEAINVYNNVLEYNSTHGLALSNLGNIRLQQKDIVEASKLFENLEISAYTASQKQPIFHQLDFFNTSKNTLHFFLYDEKT